MKFESYNSNYSFDMFTDKEVIFCKGRGKRPIVSGENRSKDQCPFCIGSEDSSTCTIMTVGKPWTMKVVENKYPAVGPLDDENFIIRGLHYVVIETNDHYKKLCDFDEEDISQLFNLYKTMIKYIKEFKEIKHIQIFKNYKREAGASMDHIHSQILATNNIPRKYLKEEENLKQYREVTGRCMICDEVNNEIKERARIVYEGKYFLAYCPKGSIFAYTVRIVPRVHTESMEEFQEEEISELSYIYVNVIKSLDNIFQDPPMNICYYFLKDSKDYHFYIEFYPRKNKLAGYELSTNIMLNSVCPEDAAYELSWNRAGHKYENTRHR